MKVIDMTGKRFGLLVVISRSKAVSGEARWKCRCDCGGSAVMRGNRLRNGKLPSCGCRPKGSKSRSLIGDQFGLLVVIDRAENSKYGKVRWKCLCNCGNISIIQGNALRGGQKSCGCQQGSYTHGMSYTGTYNSWRGMLERCTNPKHISYYLYGGRGIQVCHRWKKFENFLTDMGEKPNGKSIDRIDGNFGYNLANCRWATCVEQNSNARSNRWIETPRGRLTITEVASIVGCTYNTIQSRLNRGFTGEKLFAPPRSQKHHK